MKTQPQERKTFAILFYIRNDKINKKGEVPVYMRITIDKVKAEYATGERISPAIWNEGKIKGNSGAAGAAIAASGIPMANTLGLAAASFINSGGLALLTNGDVDVILSLGILSYNFSNGSLGFLGKKGNKALENLGYGLGSLALIADVNQLFNSTKSVLYTQKNDMISHSSIAENGAPIDSPLLSYGPAKGTGGWENVDRIKDNIAQATPGGGLKKFAIAFQKSTSEYKQYDDLAVNLVLNKQVVTAVAKVGEYLPYQGMTINCTNMASLSLWLNGIPNIGIHPYILYGTTYAYSVGARVDLFSHQLINNYKK